MKNGKLAFFALRHSLGLVACVSAVGRLMMNGDKLSGRCPGPNILPFMA